MNQISLADYRQQIEGTIEDGRYEEAVAHGRHILEEYPKDIKAYWLLGKVMLEAGQDDQASDMFQRVLSANPEHMLAWVGLSEISRRHDALEDAIWYLQRAFELATDNEMVAEELRHLYGELEGSEPKRLQLTESALAKLYLRGDLLTRAITELRKLTEEHPDRLDLKVALAEALWRDGQRLQASQVCQEILEEQPYILKANLILGEIWASSGRVAESEPYLQRAEALDPENEMAQELFGSSSPLPPEHPQIEPLSYERVTEEEEIDWMVELEEAMPVEEEEPMHAEIEIPAWLQDLAGEPAPEAAVEPEEEEPEPKAEPEAARPPEPAAEEEVVERPAVEEVAPESMAKEDVLDWLDDLEEEEEVPSGPGEAGEEEDIPAWLAELQGEREEGPAPVEEGALEGAGPEPAEIPDWLQDLAPPAAEPPEAAPLDRPAAAIEEEAPVEEPAVEEQELEQLAEEEAEVTAEAPAIEEALEEAPEEAAELPAWLEGDEMPSGDDALAWLAQLAEGKEEELRAQAQREGEARAAEIMGRSRAPAEEPPAEEETVAEPEAEPVAEPEAEAPVPEEEAFGWTAFAEEMAPEAEEAVPTEEAVAAEEAPPAEEVAEPVPEEEEEEIPAPEEEPVPEAPPVAPAEEEAVAVPPAEEPVPVLEEEAAPAEEVVEPVPEEEEEEIPAPEEEPVPEAPPAVPAPEEEVAVPPVEEPAPVLEEEAAPAEEIVEPVPEEEEAIPAPEEEPVPEAPPAVPAPEEEVTIPPVEEPAPVLEEEAAPAEEIVEPVPEEEEAIPAAEEEPVPEAPPAVPAPEEEVAIPEGVARAEAMEEMRTEDLDAFIATQRAHIDEHPGDYDAQLELGRTLWQADRRKHAVEAYERLIVEQALLDDVVADLENYTEQWRDVRVMQALGDAYMRKDQLQEALDTYRRALTSL